MNDLVAQTLFTVLGVLYSVLMSSLTGFSLDNILNQFYRERFKKRIGVIAKKSSVLFALAIVLFVLDQMEMIPSSWGIWKTLIVFAPVVLCGIYCVIAFITLQRLRMDISDRILEEKSK